MKKLFTIFVVLSLFSCKKDETMPESKYAPLKVELTGTYVESVYCKMFFSEGSQSSEYYTSANGTSISYSLDKSFKGGTSISFGSTAYKTIDDTKATASGSGISFTIKVTYNGQVIETATFNKANSIVVHANLPFIE